MGYLRFYRRFRILPGTWLNISKKGLSISFGRRGYTLTIGKTGIRFTIGLAGTGLSYTKHTSIGNIKKIKNKGCSEIETLRKELNLE
jgi:hypothetical protein